MKRIINLIISCALASTIFAQQNKFNVGVEGGPSLINIRGDAFGDYANPSIGFIGGITLQYNFPKLLSLRTNVSYERKGTQISNIWYKASSGNEVYANKLRLNFDYISVPVLLRANFGKKVDFFLNAGAFFGYLLQEKEISVGELGEPRIFSVVQTSKFYRFDTGVTLGCGITVPVKNKLLLSVELRNNTGLYNIDKPDIYNSPVINTSSTNLLLGIAYKLGTRGN